MTTADKLSIRIPMAAYLRLKKQKKRAIVKVFVCKFKKQMKKEIIFLLCFISVLLCTCTKEETTNPLKIEPGRYKGSIGRHGYDLINDKFNERRSTTHFDGENFQIQFNPETSPGVIDGSIFEVNQMLTVNLTDPLNTSSFPFFETYKEANIYNENWISVDWFEQSGDRKTENFYITVKEKQFVEAEILSVNYRELTILSLEVKIKGYLFNIENKEDSILIDAAFTTQASY